VEKEKIEEVVVRFYQENAIDSPGVQPVDWFRAVVAGP